MDKQITETLMISADLDELNERRKGLTIACRDMECNGEERWVLTHLSIPEMAKLSSILYEIANALNE